MNPTGLPRLLLVLASISCVKDGDPYGERTATASTAGSPSDSASAPSRSAAGCAGTRLTGSGIGALRIGTSVASVRSRCTVIRDTTVVAAEGMPARIVSVDVGGERVDAEIVDDKVWRLAVKSPSHRTADSLGVGTPLSRLLQLREPRGMMGEGALYFASPAHCGLSFKLSENRPLPPSGQDWNAAALRRLPAGTRVTEVLAVGC